MSSTAGKEREAKLICAPTLLLAPKKPVIIEDLVRRYFAAWNERDVPGILALMHKGAALYDAFWMESCVGPDLAQYFQDDFDDEPYWYYQVGDSIVTENGVVFRYSAHEQPDPKTGRLIYYGAEVLTLRDGLILTMSDYYCNPEKASLVEVARLAARRHGLPSHANSGLGARRTLNLRNQLSTVIEEDKANLHSSLTLSQLADKIGCPIDQLLNLIQAELGMSLVDLDDQYGTLYVRDVIPEKPDHTF